ncbi:MAG: 4'-phosphopantetheinyl transferase superfamily protein [Flavobacteriales bacterium]|nr:4'-phosphopantetheinyl transferase superfamily protein [Flavobacteriales bacterium]MBK9286222.1 4'-phosphopantetheinyl transferase superfamily protein [Flavobacteriales bacterium]MBL0034591.1 4'-phosphopantetheinyl transferase superfamily protein [Flavobacteriales bacterium]
MPEVGTRPLVVFCSGPTTGIANAVTHTPALPERGHVHVWYAPLHSLKERLGAYTELLDPVELDRMNRFRFDTDRERFILGHGLLRTLLGRYLTRDASLIRMARGPFGKPFLERKNLRFNLSDTKDAVIIAFAIDMELGADIETMTREVDHRAVSEHYFTMPEVRNIQEAAEPKRRFLELWTRKEAVLKASGVGIMEDLRVLRVDADRNSMLIEHDAFVAMASPQYHVQTWHIGADHLISLASPEAPVKVELFLA